MQNHGFWQVGPEQGVCIVHSLNVNSFVINKVKQPKTC